MEKTAQALKRTPRIKFPQRHPIPKPSGSVSEIEAIAKDEDKSVLNFLSSLKGSTILGGKASLQPKRMPVSSEEIEAILLGGCN